MKQKAQRVTGGCHCGAVRYEAEVFLDRAFYCHCEDCRRNSGQPVSMGLPVKVGTLRFTKGEPKYYFSSDSGKRGFCSHCGSGLLWRPRDPSRDWLTNLNVGSLDNPQDVRPYMHIFANRELAWHRLDDGLPRAHGDDMDQVVAAWEALLPKVGG